MLRLHYVPGGHHTKATVDERGLLWQNVWEGGRETQLAIVVGANF